MKYKKIENRKSKSQIGGFENLINRIMAFTHRNAWVLFILILIAGMYLRFYKIEEMLSFGWDQARDAWIARDIVMGKYTLIGPRTGYGHMYLGPVYFYLLAPFYYLTNLDPMAANYLNIIFNITNFLILFIVTKKIFNNNAGLFVSAIYATNSYLISINQVPWNVTLMPGIAALIYYSMIEIYRNNYKWFFALATLCGFYFHLHFTAIFLPGIVFLSLIFIKNKIKAIKYAALSLPLYLIWFIPNIIYEFRHSYEGAFKIEDFLNNYLLSFHFRFFLHRLADAFIQFSTILNFPQFFYIKYIVPVIFLVTILFFDKEKNNRLFGYMISLWFIVPLIGFSFYGGHVSEYYLLYTVPMVLFVIVYLHIRLLKAKFGNLFILLVIVFWVFYIIFNTKGFWIKKPNYGLAAQKKLVEKLINKKDVILYSEGEINAYLYQVWKDHKKD